MNTPRLWSPKLDPTPAWARRLTSQIANLTDAVTTLGEQMTSFSSDQQHLDADVTALTDGLSAVEAEIAALKAQPAAQALDFTKLDAAVARVQGDAPTANPAPTA